MQHRAPHPSGIMDERDIVFLEDEEFGSEEEPDGQLLLEIIRKEEDRDLRQLVSDAFHN